MSDTMMDRSVARIGQFAPATAVRVRQTLFLQTLFRQTMFRQTRIRKILI